MPNRDLVAAGHPTSVVNDGRGAPYVGTFTLFVIALLFDHHQFFDRIPDRAQAEREVSNWAENGSDAWVNVAGEIVADERIAVKIRAVTVGLEFPFAIVL